MARTSSSHSLRTDLGQNDIFLPDHAPHVALERESVPVTIQDFIKRPVLPARVSACQDKYFVLLVALMLPFVQPLQLQNCRP